MSLGPQSRGKKKEKVSFVKPTPSLYPHMFTLRTSMKKEKNKRPQLLLMVDSTRLGINLYHQSFVYKLYNNPFLFSNLDAGIA